MKTSSDPLHKKYSHLDFSDAKPVSEVPALARLQTEHGGKTRVTMRIDNATLSAFKARADRMGGSYQTMMNEALGEFVKGWSLADTVRDTIREELHPA
ncbi:MAG: BrnA antitoxin family protein [Zoogloeaceae bacterium]|jgi:uncharacterized protein (DUF4415 family)|nr:BrnA antitoxin family protein [Zoogloeaceae bacterium]